jgi:hypothetical protein
METKGLADVIQGESGLRNHGSNAELNFIARSEFGRLQCLRASTMVDGIVSLYEPED